jgi:hypothetical protein
MRAISEKFFDGSIIFCREDLIYSNSWGVGALTAVGEAHWVPTVKSHRIDDSSYRLNFDLRRKNKVYHNS